MSTTPIPELNFTHLRSFRAVALTGGMAAAARRLGLSQPTVSEQVAALSRALGQELFDRRDGQLVLTATGRVVLVHAEEIFTAADRLTTAVTGDVSECRRLVVGVIESLPKRVAWRLLEPALALPDPVILDCREGSLTQLLADLSVFRLDLVLSDLPLPAGIAVQAYNHLLGESTVEWFARPGVVEEGPWPRRLNGAPVLLPAASAAMRHRLDEWFLTVGVAPRLVGEFQDGALLKAAGGGGAGAFPAPTVIADLLIAELGVVRLGVCSGVTERFYAISPERRVSNPVVAAIRRGGSSRTDDRRGRRGDRR